MLHLFFDDGSVNEGRIVKNDGEIIGRPTQHT